MAFSSVDDHELGKTGDASVLWLFGDAGDGIAEFFLRVVWRIIDERLRWIGDHWDASGDGGGFE